jgi:hypothetical protein
VKIYPFPWRLRSGAPWIIEAANGAEIAVFTAESREDAELQAAIACNVLNEAKASGSRGAMLQVGVPRHST